MWRSPNRWRHRLHEGAALDLAFPFSAVNVLNKRPPSAGGGAVRKRGRPAARRRLWQPDIPKMLSENHEAEELVPCGGVFDTRKAPSPPSCSGPRRGGAQLQEPGSERRRRDVAVRRHELAIQYLRLADPVDPQLLARRGPSGRVCGSSSWPAHRWRGGGAITGGRRVNTDIASAGCCRSSGRSGDNFRDGEQRRDAGAMVAWLQKRSLVVLACEI